MNLLRIRHIAVTCCLLSSVAMAQVPTDSIKPGTLLTASGIKLSAFGKPMPLPPGNWEVAYRADKKVELSGAGPAAAPLVTLTLRNTDGAAPLLALVIAYTPEVIQIRWNGNAACEDAKAPFVENFGTTLGSLSYACALAYFHERGFKNLVSTAPSHTNAWVKEFLSPLTPHLADIPDSIVWSTIHANRDRGRTVHLTMFARPVAAPKAGEPLDGMARSWITSTGRAYIDFLEGNASTVQPYPRPGAAPGHETVTIPAYHLGG